MAHTVNTLTNYPDDNEWDAVAAVLADAVDERGFAAADGLPEVMVDNYYRADGNAITVYLHDGTGGDPIVIHWSDEHKHWYVESGAALKR